jgi:tryptophan synthase alpha chain
MSTLTKQVQVSLLFMGYYNSIYHYGLERFCKRASEVGAQGLIIPDVPVDEEEHEHFIRLCNRYSLDTIRVLSPTSTSERIKLNAKVASGFIYCTAIAGTTGGKSIVDVQTQLLLKKVRRSSKLPVAVGFGISQPQHVASLIGLADIAVVGSGVIRLVEEKGVGAVEEYIQSLVAPTITGTI